MVEIVHSKLLVLGSGPAGLSAAIYGARAGLGPRVIQGLQPGGQLTITTEVENYPGFREAIEGPWLMQEMQAQAENVGAVMTYDTISSVDFSERPFKLLGDAGTLYTCDALIIATGAQAKWLGLDSEMRLQGKGVSACATCDGFFYRGRNVAVVGGGNTAVEEALYLTNHCESVTLIHRRNFLRAEKILQERLFANPRIKVLWDREVAEFVGNGPNGSLGGVQLRDVPTGQVEMLEVQGCFVAIGHTPATELFVDKLELQDGYIVVEKGGVSTSIPGIFAAGDVADRVYRQAITAAGMGCMAALDAERFLSGA